MLIKCPWIIFLVVWRHLESTSQIKNMGIFVSILAKKNSPGKELNGCESFQSSALNQAKTIMYYLRQTKPKQRQAPTMVQRAPPRHHHWQARASGLATLRIRAPVPGDNRTARTIPLRRPAAARASPDADSTQHTKMLGWNVCLLGWKKWGRDFAATVTVTHWRVVDFHINNNVSGHGSIQFWLLILSLTWPLKCVLLLSTLIQPYKKGLKLMFTTWRGSSVFPWAITTCVSKSPC